MGGKYSCLKSKTNTLPGLGLLAITTALCDGETAIATVLDLALSGAMVNPLGLSQLPSGVESDASSYQSYADV